MESFEQLRARAKKHFKVADHMLTQTYPLVQDSKLLLAVLDNIFLAVSTGMFALLAFERENKLIPPFHESFESMFNTFKLRVAGKYHFTPEDIGFVLEIKNIIANHKNSAVEFSRKDKFVICLDDYKLESFQSSDIKKYLKKTKSFLDKVDAAVSRC